MPIRQSQHSTEKKPSVDVFIRACRRPNDRVDESERGKCLKMITFKLTDTSLLITEAVSPATPEELVKELRRVFSKVQDLHDLEEEMENTSQNKDESVIEYAARIREILRKTTDRLRESYNSLDRKAYLDESIIEVTAKAKRSYVRGLIPSIGSHLILYNAQEFNQVVDQAKIIEHEIEKQQQRRHKTSQNTTKYCELHRDQNTHSTAECTTIKKIRKSWQDTNKKTVK